MLTIKLKAEAGVINHSQNKYFDEVFEVFSFNDETEVSTDFDLTNYNGTVKIYDVQGGTELYTKSNTDPELVFSTNTIRWKDKIEIATAGKLYFEFVLSHKTDAEIVYKLYFGEFNNVE